MALIAIGAERADGARLIEFRVRRSLQAAFGQQLYGGWQMKVIGILTAAGGAFLAIVAVFMTTSVHNDASYQFGNYMPASDTINIGLLQNQHLTFLAACFLFLAGVIISCTAYAIDAIRGVGVAAPVEAAELSDQGEPYQLLARAGAMSEEERQDAAKADRTIIIVAIALGVIALIAVFAFGIGTTKPDSDTTMTNNVAAMADAMEQQADNLDAIAGSTK